MSYHTQDLYSVDPHIADTCIGIDQLEDLFGRTHKPDKLHTSLPLLRRSYIEFVFNKKFTLNYFKVYVDDKFRKRYFLLFSESDIVF